MTIGHIINPHGIPDECPNCKAKPLEVEVKNYSLMWHDGDVCCVSCGHKIRSYDAG
jgi:hypothetical protein